jgi:hypothetical protein
MLKRLGFSQGLVGIGAVLEPMPAGVSASASGMGREGPTSPYGSGSLSGGDGGRRGTGPGTPLVALSLPTSSPTANASAGTSASGGGFVEKFVPLRVAHVVTFWPVVAPEVRGSLVAKHHAGQVATANQLAFRLGVMLVGPSWVGTLVVGAAVGKCVCVCVCVCASVCCTRPASVRERMTLTCCCAPLCR